MSKRGRQALEEALYQVIHYHETEFHLTLAELVGTLECIKLSEHNRVVREAEQKRDLEKGEGDTTNKE